MDLLAIHFMIVTDSFGVNYRMFRHYNSLSKKGSHLVFSEHAISHSDLFTDGYPMPPILAEMSPSRPSDPSRLVNGVSKDSLTTLPAMEVLSTF